MPGPQQAELRILLLMGLVNTELQEWLQDIDDPDDKHRHVSFLWGQFCGDEINREQTPHLIRVAGQCLVFRGEEATAWSISWKINLWANFGGVGMGEMLVHCVLMYNNHVVTLTTQKGKS